MLDKTQKQVSEADGRAVMLVSNFVRSSHGKRLKLAFSKCLVLSCLTVTTVSLTAADFRSISEIVHSFSSQR